MRPTRRISFKKIPEIYKEIKTRRYRTDKSYIAYPSTVPGDTEKSLSVNVLFIMLVLRAVLVVVVVVASQVPRVYRDGRRSVGWSIRPKTKRCARRTGPQREPQECFPHPHQEIFQHLPSSTKWPGWSSRCYIDISTSKSTFRKVT